MALTSLIDDDVDYLAGNPTYVRRGMLSSGTFGTVALYLHVPSGQPVAIKFLRRDKMSETEDRRRYVMLEVLNHRWMKHPHVIKFRELFLTEQHICIVMEYANGGTLFSWVQRATRIPEPLARWFFQQLMMAVDYCHRPGAPNASGASKPAVFIRDIKPENILLNIPEQRPNAPGMSVPFIKLCDFGYSKNSYVSDPKSKVGTLAYMAPEVVQASSRESREYDGAKADVWSCGVTLYVMLVGKYPFASMNELMAGQWTLPYDVEGTLTPDCRDLLSKLLVAAPSQRPSLQQVLSHRWVQTDLPEGALATNDRCLAITDYSDVQSEQEIVRVLNEAWHSNSSA